MKLPVVYVDNHVLVVDKPAGMLSQEDRTKDEDVLSIAKQWVKIEYEKPGAVYLGLVHRLDRPASGLMVLARTSKAAARLSEQFKNRTVTKTYLALVEGAPVKGDVYEDWLQKWDETVRVVEADKKGAKKAKLTILDVRKIGNYSLVRIELATGRAHQIRVQLAARKFPIVGDFRYGSRTHHPGKNLALHAGRLKIEHPTKKETMVFTSEVPSAWPAEAREYASQMLSKS
jgi:23S rRNA pseudouridine1911/1915/1917 synthase